MKNSHYATTGIWSGFGGCNANMGSRMSKMKRGFAVWGKAPKLIRLDYYKTKQYNYHCKFIVHFRHLLSRLVYALEVAPSLANLKKILQKTYLIFFISLSLIFSACAVKPIAQIQTKEVLIPIACDLPMPKKPKEDGSFESHKALGIYFLEVESTLKDCLGLNKL
ncbi:hypothetical protein [Helicobacter pullorum]|uniref:hypothetical protein n=1 Tax=Helicobacter pullorum TaxID=35818 RepID=UPI00241C615A|nr:hypothetical protein [Helicobacter pullorum]